MTLDGRTAVQMSQQRNWIELSNVQEGQIQELIRVADGLDDEAVDLDAARNDGCPTVSVGRSSPAVRATLATGRG